jgi:hypothetical protein
MSTPVPRLRDVEAFPVEQDGERYVALRDPAGYATGVLLLPVGLLEIVALFDGAHTVPAIQDRIEREHGQRIEDGHVEKVIEALDEQGFLDSAGFAARRETADQAFLAAPSRPARHAGGAYASEADALRSTMDGFFAAPAGPGPIGAFRGGGVRGLIAPHIDFHRGGPAYAWGYRELAERGESDLFVIFGTSHTGLRQPFALTRKDFDTPLGPARTDVAFVEALARRARQDCFGAELAHRNEHSIEFQAVFLQYLYAGRREISIVPVLTSFVHEALALGRRPEDDPRVAAFLDALGETVATSGRRVTLVAGADLAHMGPRFGDPEPISPVEFARIEREDRALLATVEAGDAEAFFESARADNDRRRTCGLSPIYTLLRTLGPGPGSLARYGQTPDPECVVTFASVVF